MLNSRKYNKDIIKPILFSIAYTIYFYLATKFIVEKDILISLKDVGINNVGQKFMGDFFVILLIPCILMIIYRKNLKEFKLNFTHKNLQYTLITILVVSFLFHRNFTVRGIYQLFFSLVIVGFGEEFVFHGYVYNQLSKHNRLCAIIISGFFFGIIHAILPGVLAGKAIGGIGLSMLSEIVGGILMGYYFIYILEKSNSLYIPIFVHAIMNYAFVGVGVITMIGSGFYLQKLDKKKYPSKDYNEIL